MKRDPVDASLDERPDEALMRAYQAGDVAAFESLYARYERRVFAFVLRFVGDRALAEELFQETFARAVAAAPRWKPRAPFAAWIFRIARNLCLDHVKAHGRRRTVSLDRTGDDPPEAPEPAAGGASPDAEVFRRRTVARLEAAILDLEPAQREVLLLRERAGLSFEEISETTGMSVSTLKSRMRYALGHLRKALEGTGFDRAEALDDGL